MKYAKNWGAIPKKYITKNIPLPDKQEITKLGSHKKNKKKLANDNLNRNITILN